MLATAQHQIRKKADSVAADCCEFGDGVTFPNFPHDVKETWDTRVCNYQGDVTGIKVRCLFPNKELNCSKANLSKQNDAVAGFSKCCLLTGGSSVWGGNCCTVLPDGRCV